MNDGYVLDTNVVAELWYGVELRPEGARRNRLTRWLEELLAAGFDERILPFDAEAGRIWGRLMAEGRRSGRSPSVRDAEIAAVAMANGLAVVTRNVRDFEPMGLPWLDPWRGAG